MIMGHAVSAGFQILHAKRIFNDILLLPFPFPSPIPHIPRSHSSCQFPVTFIQPHSSRSVGLSGCLLRSTIIEICGDAPIFRCFSPSGGAHQHPSTVDFWSGYARPIRPLMLGRNHHAGSENVSGARSIVGDPGMICKLPQSGTS